MIDFELTNTGDLFFEKTEEVPPLKVSFAVSELPVFKMQFIQGKKLNERYGLEVPRNKCKIKFITNTSIKLPEVKTLTAEDVIKQRIIIQLRTELGELPNNPSFGTALIKERHKEITDKNLTERVKNIIINEISPYVENPDVIVERKKCDSYFYNNNLNIYIYKNNELIYSFEFEV